MAVGVDHLDLYHDIRSAAVVKLDAKIHISSVISDAHKGARYCTVDIKDCSLIYYEGFSVHAHSLSLYPA